VFDADIPSATRQPSNPVTLFIGPEGGFSERELQLARTSGASFERLGPRRLRAETAAIVAVTIVAARSGDI
jgi:16S rRNA (uracil1498-N3)-methyltransferase